MDVRAKLRSIEPHPDEEKFEERPPEGGFIEFQELDIVVRFLEDLSLFETSDYLENCPVGKGIHAEYVNCPTHGDRCLMLQFHLTTKCVEGATIYGVHVMKTRSGVFRIFLGKDMFNDFEMSGG